MLVSEPAVDLMDAISMKEELSSCIYFVKEDMHLVLHCPSLDYEEGGDFNQVVVNAVDCSLINSRLKARKGSEDHN